MVRGPSKTPILKHFINKKRRNLYLLPSYTSRLLALPINSRTATAEAHASICNQYSRFRISQLEHYMLNHVLT